MGAAEVDLATGAQLVEALERLHRRAQHRPDEVRPRARRGEHVGDEQPLGDLHALLLALQMLGLRVDLCARGDQPRKALRGAVDELVEAQRRGVVVGQGRVELLGVLAQEALARVVVGPLEVLNEHAADAMRT